MWNDEKMTKFENALDYEGLFWNNGGTCRKEARETKHFLRMAVRAAPELKPEVRRLWVEAKELHLIFSKIWRSGK
jgi:hypothetical protein